MDFHEFLERSEQAMGKMMTPEQIRQLNEQFQEPKSLTLNEYISLMRQQTDLLFRGLEQKPVLSPDLQQLADILLKKSLMIDGSGFYQNSRHYASYLEMHCQNADDTKRFLDELKATVGDPVDAATEDDNPEPILYLLESISTRETTGMTKVTIPQMCLISGHLFGEGGNLPTLVEGWYQDTLENLGIAQQSVDSYLSTLRSHIGEDDEMMDYFLCDLRDDMTSFHAACLNLATISAIHAQREDCAVYVGTTPYSLSRDKKSATQKRMDALLSLPVYAKYNAALQASSGIQGDIVHVPSFVSVIDVEEFVKYWKICWQLAAASMQSGVRSQVQHICQPVGDDKKQARINWKFPFGKEKFSVRIDKEIHPHRSLSIDIGKAELEDALIYAEEVGQHSLQQDVVMGYSSILDQRGSHTHLLDPTNPFPRHQEFYYPSIMKSEHIKDINKRMAIVASVILTQGKEMGLFQSDRTFSHHCRRGSVDCPDNWDNFEAIVRRFQTIVPRN